MATAHAASNTRTSYKMKQLLTSKVVSNTDGANRVMRWLFPTASSFSPNLDAISILRLQTPHIYFNIFSNIFTNVRQYFLTSQSKVHFPTAADSTRYRVKVNSNDATPDVIDDIDDYWNARYLSAGEAAWRILGFHIAKKYPAVSALPIHLPGSTSNKQYAWKSGVTPTLSQLERYFLRPLGTFPDGPLETQRSFETLTYAEYYSLFRLVKYTEANDFKPNYYLEQLSNRRSTHACRSPQQRTHSS